MKRRGPGEGSVYRRPDGRWVGAVHLGYENGRRRRKNVYGRTRREVQLKLLAVQRDVAENRPVSTERQTTAQFLNRWLKDGVAGSVGARTFVSYEQIVKLHLIPTVGRVPLNRLSVQDVQALLRQKSLEGLSPRTVQYIRAVLRQSLNAAIRWGTISRNPAALAHAPKVQPYRPLFLNREEVRTLVEGVSGDRLGALYVLAVTTGLRQGEILGLRWQDLDIDGPGFGALAVRHQLTHVHGRAVLVPPKTRSSRRTIAVAPMVIAALCAHRRRQLEERLIAGSRWVSNDFVFTTTVGSPLEGSRVSKQFQRRLETLGLPRIRFHDLRHSFASLMASQGVPARVTMEALGHSDVRTTLNIYTHVMPDLVQEAAAKVEEALSRAG